METRKLNGWGLIEIPDDTGVSNVGGRPGAALGPPAFLAAFGRLTGRFSISERLIVHQALSEIAEDVAANHESAARLIENAHRETGLSVVVGGGHDHGYSHLLGLSRAIGPKTRLGCINIDAHLDVRKPAPLISSGSPFYLALERGVLLADRLVEFGTQEHCNSAELWRYVTERKVETVPFASLRNGRAVPLFERTLERLSEQCDVIALSFDVDSCASAFAPGASASQAEGFSPSEIIEMLELSGMNMKVTSLGVFELNPVHDQGNMTATLCATGVHHFLTRALQRD